jgi:hypothetical protein
MILTGIMIFGTYSKSDGAYMAAGTVKVDGAPAEKRIVLQDRRSMSYIGSAMSGPDGSWKIGNIWNPGDRNALVTVFDDSGVYNAEVADHITLVPQTEP